MIGLEYSGSRQFLLLVYCQSQVHHSTVHLYPLRVPLVSDSQVVRLGILCSCLGKRGLLPTPEIDASLVILAARTPVDLNVSEGQVGDSERISIRARVRERTWSNAGQNLRAVGGPLLREFGKRGRWGVVIIAVGIVLLPRRSLARPFCAAVIDLEIEEVPERNATDVVVRDCFVDTGPNNFGLVQERPLHIRCVIAPLKDSTGPRLRDDKRFPCSAVGLPCADGGGGI
jgi:hypothetical protein